MRLHRSIGLGLLAIGMGSPHEAALGADSPAVAALREKGLTRSGQAYVTEAEGPVLARMKEARAALARHAALAERQSLAEQGTLQLNQLEERRIEIQSHVDALNQRINEQGGQPPGNLGRPGGGGFPAAAGASPMIAERNQAQSVLAEVAAEQKLIKAQTPLAKDRAALDENLKKSDEAYRAALAAVRPKVDEVLKKYADLAADESVRKAMDEIKATSKGKIKLGPSDPFLAAVKQLDQAERQFLGKKAPAPASKKKARAKK